MAFSAMTSIAQFTRAGFKPTPGETYHRRLEICGQCEHHTGLRCAGDDGLAGLLLGTTRRPDRVTAAGRGIDRKWLVVCVPEMRFLAAGVVPPMRFKELNGPFEPPRLPVSRLLPLVVNTPAE
jgi:hypothetical protein